MFPGVCWGPKDKRRAVVFVRMGWGGEGSRRGHQVCKTAQPERKARLRYSPCPPQQGTCFSLQEGVPVGELRLKAVSCPSLWASPYHHLHREEGAREERHHPPSVCLPRNRGKTPLKRVPSTHLPQLEGEAVYSARLEQTEMNFQIAPFFSQAPSYRFLCGGAPGIWKLICTPSTRPGGSQRWRERSAASTKDGRRWCRLLPALPTATPPSPRSSWGPARHGRGWGHSGGIQSFPPVSQATRLLGQGRPLSSYC